MNRKNLVWDDGCRQLRLDLWQKGYAKKLDTAVNSLIRLDSPKEPNLLEFPRDSAGWNRYLLAMREYESDRRQYNRQAKVILEIEPRLAGERLAQRGTEMSWTKIRKLVYERDKGLCYICKTFVEWQFYECGHIVDRVCGGSDLPENLVTMCNVCNRGVKPLHKTRKEFDEWMDRGGEKHELVKMVVQCLTQDELKLLDRKWIE